MRCMALAEGFVEVGVKNVFVVKSDEERILELIASNGYELERVPNDSNYAEDASLTLSIAERYSAKVITTDISNVVTLEDMQGYQNYLEALGAFGAYLITIDGFGRDCISDKLDVPSNVVIIPYYGAQNHKYMTKAKCLLGPSFFILRREFLDAAKVPREIRKDVSNILVSMGGVDPAGCTIKVVNALTKLGRAHLNIKVVIGSGFAADSKRQIKNVLKKARYNSEIIVQSNAMAQLMLWADLAIINSGLTLYETAITQTPAVVLSQYPYHAVIMDDFSKAGFFCHLGYGPQVSDEAIVKAVEQLSDDSTLRKEMAQNGRKLIDGKGVERVISSIPKELII